MNTIQGAIETTRECLAGWLLQSKRADIPADARAEARRNAARCLRMIRGYKRIARA